MKNVRVFLLPLMLVVAIELLIALQEFAPNLLLPEFFGYLFIGGNFFAYCFVGWLAVHGGSGQLRSAAIAGIIILCFEATIRAVWVAQLPNIDTKDPLLEILQLFYDIPSGLSATQINVLVVFIQYFLFSPVYITLSILGGAVAKWRLGARKI